MSNVIDLAYWRKYYDVYHTNEEGVWYDQKTKTFKHDLLYREPKVIDSGNNNEEKYSEDGYAEEQEHDKKEENDQHYCYHEVVKNDYDISFEIPNYKINTIEMFWRY